MRMLKAVVVTMGLMGCLPSLAYESLRPQADQSITAESFVGTWLVVPRIKPNTAPPGEVPRIFFISKHGDSLQGTFHWFDHDFPLTDFKLNGDVLGFTVGFRDKPFRMFAKVLTDRKLMDVWSKEELAGVAPFHARQILQEEFAAVMAAAPRLYEHHWRPQPLPPLNDVPANGLALTPPMGWSSWNAFREGVDDKAIREMADIMVSSGLRDAGYIYLNIDDAWQGHRDADGVLHPNEKFPDMKGLADYVHARGLKLGIYSSPGPLTCANYLGSHGHEKQDAKTFAEWGVDLLKYDWCGALLVYDTKAVEMQALYQLMGEALQATGRPIVYSVCQYGLNDVGSWGRKVGGNLWRTEKDLGEGNLWRAIDHRFDSNGKPEHTGPGGWNDADMMLVGLPGLTDDEYRTHFTLWAMYASPIILGNDLRVMTAEVKSILANKEVIAIDQDALGKQGRRMVKKGATEVWTKPLADGSTAIALFNRGETTAAVEARWSELGLSEKQRVRDLWKQRDLGIVLARYKVTIPAHGSVLLRGTAVQ